ncbi:uncharacterized protein LOC133159647 isoform X2 [Syngnathus typhle]|uniref:uncharacterized protein LOC133159647 isoform X2 n=1 Tax=Syngnathus typhle TaxID=161592 RepID=UPI002A69A723|nr:uncharacterized protein LOC133159647 isoform X2 [Syngnathus typhle]
MAFKNNVLLWTAVVSECFQNFLHRCFLPSWEASWKRCGSFQRGFPANLAHELPRYRQHVTCPTRGAQTPDHCYTMIKDAYHSAARAALGLSDHCLVHLIPAYRQKLKTSKPVVRTVRKWTVESRQDLQACFDCTDRGVFEAATSDLHDLTDTVTSYISFCEDLCVQTKTFCTNNKDKPWFTPNLRRLRKIKEEAYRIFGRDLFRQTRNTLNREVRKARRCYGENLKRHLSANPDPSTVWKEEEVRQMFRRQKTRKAPGPDGVSPSCLKICAEQLAPTFARIFNRSLELCEVPSCFKSSTIVPVAKKPAIIGLNDYRPVALTSVVMKYFERLVLNHLKDADDTTLIGLIQDGDETAYRQELERLVHWCSQNHLELNPLKTVEMTVDFRRDPSPLLPLTIRSNTILSTDTFKFLGTTISQDLKWTGHINSVRKKAQQRLYFLRQLKKFNLL